MPKSPDLDAAYALETPDDNRELYAQWAKTYDHTFAEAMDYQLPQAVAAIVRESNPQGPVLDVGAGTGLAAQALGKEHGGQVHALDLSAQMLEVAMAKGLYSRAITADLTQSLPMGGGIYGTVMSSGTFTHGHVGPAALDELLRVAAIGALFVLSINADHYAAHGFKAKFIALETAIKGFELREAPIYGTSAQGTHQADRALIAVFTKA